MCSTCHYPGLVISCCKCSRSQHPYCASPEVLAAELVAIRDGADWYCWECGGRRTSRYKPQFRIFKHLLARLKKTRSRYFKLPKSMKLKNLRPATNEDNPRKKAKKGNPSELTDQPPRVSLGDEVKEPKPFSMNTPGKLF